MYQINYCSMDRTVTNDETNIIQEERERKMKERQCWVVRDDCRRQEAETHVHSIARDLHDLPSGTGGWPSLTSACSASEVEGDLVLVGDADLAEREEWSPEPATHTGRYTHTVAVLVCC